MSKHSLISWNLPRSSKGNRIPGARNLLKLAGMLEVSEQTIFDLCNRPNDQDVTW